VDSLRVQNTPAPDAVNPQTLREFLQLFDDSLSGLAEDQSITTRRRIGDILPVAVLLASALAVSGGHPLWPPPKHTAEYRREPVPLEEWGLFGENKPLSHGGFSAATNRVASNVVEIEVTSANK
jgi:hypothetical protein